MHMRTWLVALAALAIGACGTDTAETQADTSSGTEELDTGGEEDTAAIDVDPSSTVQAPADWVADMTRIPTSIHMTWQRDPATTLTFQWATADTDTEGYIPRLWLVPKAEVDQNSGAMAYRDAWVTEGSGVSYQNTLNGIPIEEGTFVVWTVEATGLDPETEYVYRLGTWDSFDRASGEFVQASLSESETIRTGKPRGSETAFKFVMAGDSRGGMDRIRTHIDRLTSYEADMWFFNGDMTNGGTQGEWTDWWDAMQPLLRTRVLMPVQGNHEIFADLYYVQMALPQAGDELSEELKEHAWSVDYGNVHFIGLDSNSTELVEEQMAWLEVDLAAAEADEGTDWIIVMFHHTVYSASNHGPTKRVQKNWVPIFEDYGVDLVFTGHDHNYERTVPIREDKEVDADSGVVYVVAGGFFAPAYSNGNEWWTAKSVHGNVGNWVRIEVEGKTLKAVAYPVEGGPGVEGSEPLDTFELTK